MRRAAGGRNSCCPRRPRNRTASARLQSTVSTWAPVRICYAVPLNAPLNARSFVAGVAAALLLVCIGETFYHAHVDGNSMEPMYRDGDHVIIDKLTYRFRQPS